MSQKKMVSRNAALAFGIICIFLVAGLGGAFAYYMIDRNNTISALNSQISDRSSQISELNATVINLNSTVIDLVGTINLNKSKVVYATSDLQYPFSQGLDLPMTFIDLGHQGIGSAGLEGYFFYAGYIIVQINSTSNDTYINYTCASHVGTFSLQTDIRMVGTTILPVLPLAGDYWNYPSEGIFMTVSTHTAVHAKMNITATYCY